MNERINENSSGAMVLTLSDALLTTPQKEAPTNITAASLTLIGHVPGISIQDLSCGLELSHPGTVHLVDRMVANGLVQRKQSTEDRRTAALFLTQADLCRAAGTHNSASDPCEITSNMPCYAGAIHTGPSLQPRNRSNGEFTVRETNRT